MNKPTMVSFIIQEHILCVRVVYVQIKKNHMELLLEINDGIINHKIQSVIRQAAAIMKTYFDQLLSIRFFMKNSPRQYYYIDEFDTFYIAPRTKDGVCSIMPEEVLYSVRPEKIDSHYKKIIEGNNNVGNSKLS